MPRWRGLCEPLISSADWRVEQVAPAAAMPLARIDSGRRLLSTDLYWSGDWLPYESHNPVDNGKKKRFLSREERDAEDLDYESEEANYPSKEEQEAALAEGNARRQRENDYLRSRPDAAPIGRSVVDEVFARFLQHKTASRRSASGAE